jgi:hypothetical protein
MITKPIAKSNKIYYYNTNPVELNHLCRLALPQLVSQQDFLLKEAPKWIFLFMDCMTQEMMN